MFSEKSKFILTFINKVEWLYRSSYEAKPPKQVWNPTLHGIPLLNEENRTLAGVEIQSFDHKIMDDQKRKEIERRLFKMKFTVCYKKGEAWAEGKYYNP